MVVNVGIQAAPNTVVSVLGVTLVRNEQLPVAGAGHGLEVNAGRAPAPRSAGGEFPSTAVRRRGRLVR